MRWVTPATGPMTEFPAGGHFTSSGCKLGLPWPARWDYTPQGASSWEHGCRLRPPLAGGGWTCRVGQRQSHSHGTQRGGPGGHAGRHGLRWERNALCYTCEPTAPATLSAHCAARGGKCRPLHNSPPFLELDAAPPSPLPSQHSGETEEGVTVPISTLHRGLGHREPTHVPPHNSACGLH